MPDSIRSQDGQTLVGGAPVSRRVLEKALMRAPRLVAADGGADTILAAGLTPESVIGDMDSISDGARAAFADKLHPIAEQNSTDFAKALRSTDAPFTLAVGFLGARVDHFLACLSELARTRAPVILLDGTDCICIAPPQLRLTMAPGARISLWPLARTTGRGTGLRWPIDGLVLDPVGRVGTSNEATGPVTLDIEGGPMAVILDANALDTLLDALQLAPRGSQGRAV
ncbi:MAG: thiamine diphosphokinase [Pseudomonadota bacterium]